MKRFFLYLILICACVCVGAQNPVTTSVKKQAVSGHDDLIDLVFSFTIQPGWHVYGPENGDDGPTKMTFNTEQLEGCQLEGGLRLSPAPKRVMDNVFGCEVTYFENKGSATQRLRLKGGAWKAVGYLEYGTCNDESCMPPTPIEFSFEGTLPPPSLLGRERFEFARWCPFRPRPWMLLHLAYFAHALHR